MNRLLAAAAIALYVMSAPCLADPTIHYAPAENLERVDLALIDSARQEIDMAAYVLADWTVMQALIRAADRGVAVRIYLDGTRAAGDANFSATGEKRQDNDLVILESAEAAAAFKHGFDARFSSGEALSIGARQ